MPIKGNAGFNLDTDFNVSSDALFKAMEALTEVTINSPIINCSPPSCSIGSSTGGFSEDGEENGGGPPPGVNVIAEKMAGPFQIAHLQ